MANYSFTKYDANAITHILKLYSVPPKLIKDIRRSLVADAIQESDLLEVERIYSAMAMAVLNTCGEEAIVDVITEHDRLMGAITREELTWPELMKDLRDRAGIVVRKGDAAERGYVEINDDGEL